MATDEQLAQLRRLTALQLDDEVYTDSILGGYIDDLGMTPAAALVWKEKAAAVAAFVDITESGSSRRLSQLKDSYLGMASGVNPQETTDTGRSFTVGIERV